MLLTSRPLLLALAAGLLTSACASSTRLDADGARVELPRTPTQQYTLRTEEAPVPLELVQHESGLSARQHEALRDHAALWRSGGVGNIVIEGPTDGGDVAYRMSQAAAQTLEAYGVPASAIRIAGYYGAPTATIRISFLKPQVVVDRCGRSWDNLAATGANIEPVNFGCAINANRAVMVANPADIATPREMTPADAARRQTVLDKYRAGQITSSEFDPQASGAVSTAVQ